MRTGIARRLDTDTRECRPPGQEVTAVSVDRLIPTGQRVQNLGNPPEADAAVLGRELPTVRADVNAVLQPLQHPLQVVGGLSTFGPSTTTQELQVYVADGEDNTPSTLPVVAVGIPAFVEPAGQPDGHRNPNPLAVLAD